MTSKLNRKRLGESNVEIYDLGIRKFKLESDNLYVFTIRTYELESLNIKDLPLDHKFIFCDTSTLLINIRSSVERLDEESFMLTIVETSKCAEWNNMESVNDYFISRKEMLSKRQKDVFDLILNKAYFNNDLFLLEYQCILKDNRFMKAIKYSSTILDTVNLASNYFNN